MKKSYLIVLMLTVLMSAFTSCKNDDNDIGTVFTIKISPDYSPDPAEADYFFASDSLGNVLDTKLIEIGKDVNLTINKPLNKINLTLCRLFKTEAQEAHTISTFLNVPIDQSINFASIAKGPPAPIGSAKITISNFTGIINSLIISNGYDNDAALNGYVNSQELNNKILKTEINLVQNNSEIVLNGLRKSATGYDPVYFSLKGVNTGDDISIDYDNFLAYPKKLEVNLTGFLSGSIMGFKGQEKNEGHWLHTMSNVLSLPFLGYLDGYNNYLTSIASYETKPSVSYTKFGGIPTSINLSKPSVNIISEGLNNFNYSFSEPYTYRRSFWFYDENSNYFSWFVHGEKSNQKVALPEEILNKYNFLPVDKLKYGGSTFTKCIDGSYDGHIKEYFTGDRTNYEFYRYSGF